MARRMVYFYNKIMEYRKFIKLLVACMILLAVAKLIYHSKIVGSGDFINMNHVFIPDQFWKLDNKVRPIDVMPDAQTNKNKSKILTTAIHQKLKNKTTVAVPVKKKVEPLRVVHLDLKGAAPKVSFFQELFPLISSLGANGILVEYEDMFPYEGNLEILRSPFAYNEDNIEEIGKLASLYNLELIPLVQVFGHLEFVLKHEKFFKLREIDNFPNSLNPLHPDSLKLVTEMLTQVLKKHPKTKWFHIGADEVYGLGEGIDTKKQLKQNNKSIGELFLGHVTKVCHFLAEQRPEMKLIFWDDMLRQLDATLLKKSGMANLASPMIWKYDSNMNVAQIGQLLSNYQKAGFQNVWFASAFKGASGNDQRWTPMIQHVQNHIAWLKVIDSMSKYNTLTLVGIALTGWQRYDHYTVLCELLPVAVPSLAVCLQTLKYGSFNSLAEMEVEKYLGCKVDLRANMCKGTGMFPGFEIYRMINKIHEEFQKSIETVFKNYHVRGYFSSYQRKYNFANPRFIEYFKNPLFRMLSVWDSFFLDFKNKMMSVYFLDTVEEWMEENVNQHMDKLHSLAKDVERILKLKARPKSLLVNPSANSTKAKNV